MINTHDIYVIAEAAQGYEGSVEKALLLVLSAHRAGADAIKFQIIYADELCVPGYEYYDLFKSLEMADSKWKKVVDYANELNVDVFFDVFGSLSLGLAKKVNVKKIKIHSTSFFDDELFDAVQQYAKHILISVGGIRQDELEKVLRKRIDVAKGKLLIMYGFQAEPTPVDKNNIARIETISHLFKLPIGFMDHSEGTGLITYTLSSLALGMGVKVFEKHITIDRALELEDYISALGSTEFTKYVNNLHSLYSAIGTTSLELTKEEEIYRSKALKVVVSTIDIKKGETIKSDMVALKRPDTRIDDAILNKNDVIGCYVLHDIESGRNISRQDIK